MNLIRGEQKPQSDLGFSLTSSLGSNGLGIGAAGGMPRTPPVLGQLGWGKCSWQEFDLFSSLAPRVLPLSMSEPHPTSS